MVIILIPQFQQRWRYKMQISLIVAMDENRVIGKNNQIPWHLPADLKRFRKLTMNKHVIMGRKTFESIGKPLQGRYMIIMTRDKDYSAPGCEIARSVEEALEIAPQDTQELMIAGGVEIYKQFFDRADRVYLTRIHEEFEGDTYFPELKFKDWNMCSIENFFPDEKNPYSYTFYTFERKDKIVFLNPFI